MECCEIMWNDIFRAALQLGSIQTKKKAKKFVIWGIPAKDFDNLRDRLRSEYVKFDINGRKIIVCGDATFSLMHAHHEKVITLTFSGDYMCAQVVT